MKFRKPTVNELKKDGKNLIAAALLCGLYIGIVDWVFGGVCFIRLLFGVPCPACGMTRACVLLLEGNLTGAWQMHAMVFPVIFGVLLYVFCKYFVENSRKIWMSYVIIMVIVAICYYVARMVLYFPDREPMIFYHNNLVTGLLHWKH